MIGNLSNKGNYDYQKKDVDLIIRALNDNSDKRKPIRHRFVEWRHGRLLITVLQIFIYV